MPSPLLLLYPAHIRPMYLPPAETPCLYTTAHDRRRPHWSRIWVCLALARLALFAPPTFAQSASQSVSQSVPQSVSQSLRPTNELAVRERSRDDTAAVHRELRRSIEKYQDSWRKAWQKVEVKRHNYINLTQIRGWSVRGDGLIFEPLWEGDRAALNLTPDLRRYLAMLCYVDSPTDRQIEYIKSRQSVNIGTPKGLKAAPDNVTPSNGRLNIRAGSLEREMNFASARSIIPSPNYGTICPSWLPPDEKLPLDEGEAIDLALPPVSREPLRREREGLIRALADAKVRYPDDLWIAGQHLRFVLDQREPQRALEAAQKCQGGVVGCARLAGLAREHAGNIAQADAAYRFADSVATLSASTDPKACVNAETWLLLPVADRDAVTSRSCDEQRAFVDRMWWLADPLWSMPGNERYVAHNSRQTHAALRAVLDRDERYVWQKRGGGDAMRELLIRYGWPGYTYWPGGQFEEELNKIREDPKRPRVVAPPYTAKEYSADRTALVPKMDGILRPFDITSRHWTLNIPPDKDPDGWWPQEHLMLLTKLELLATGQSSQWRRDSTIAFALVVDQALSALDTAARGLSTATLMGSTGPNDLRVLAETSLGAGDRLQFLTAFPSEPLVLSAEVRARSIREPARRLRYGLHPPPSLSELRSDDVAMSDLTFLRLQSRDIALPTDLSTVQSLMAGTLNFSRNEALALYWESYGFLPSDSVNFELRIYRREDINVARRLGAALGVASALDDSVSIKWSEPDARISGSVIPALVSTIGRSVALDLKALPNGNYSVSIEMRRGASVTARGERAFSIRD